MSFLDLLKHPDAETIEDLDAEETVSVHARIIRSKPILRRLYTDFYRLMGEAVDYREDGLYVELASGGGFIKEILPKVVTSDVVPHPNIDSIFAAESMPLDNESVRGILILNGFHHFREPALALAEIERVLVAGGRMVMIEPANTWWGRLVAARLHHEPFDPSAGWSLPEDGGRLSGGNGALPWIVAVRDRKIFRQRFRSLAIESMSCHTPVAYLASGGLTWRQLAPGWGYPVVRATERLLSPAARWLGMFMTVVIGKTHDG